MTDQLMGMDAWEQSIRENADHYNVVLFQPRRSTRLYETFDNLEDALVYSRETLTANSAIRSAMVYAVDENEHHALVGTMNSPDMKFKVVVPKKKGRKKT